MSTTVRTSATASIAVPAVSEARARCARTVRASDALVPVRYGRKCRSPVERAAAEAVIERRFCVIEPLLGTKTACVATGRSRATHYRSLTPQRPRSKAPRPSPPNKPTEGEATGVLEALRSQRVVDFSPTEAYFTLLDEGTCLGSCSTYYRLLRAHGELHERRRQRRTPTSARAESSWPRDPLAYEAGTSRSSRTQNVAAAATSTSCSTSSAAMSSGGWWPPSSPDTWPPNASPTPSPDTASSPASCRCTRIGAVR